MRIAALSVQATRRAFQAFQPNLGVDHLLAAIAYGMEFALQCREVRAGIAAPEIFVNKGKDLKHGFTVAPYQQLKPSK